jgi:hypothetical protein
MNTYDFEQSLRDRMKAHAAELDGAARPAPPLRTLLADRPLTSQSTGFGRLRLGFSAATVVVAVVSAIVLVLLSGSVRPGGLPATSPLSSATPSPVDTLASLSPSPSLSESLSESAAVLSPFVTPLETQGFGSGR